MGVIFRRLRSILSLTGLRLGPVVCLGGALAMAGCTTPVQTVPIPADDGTACYSIARLPFYQSANVAFVTDQETQNRNATARGVAVVGGVAAITGLLIGGRTGNTIAAVGAVTAVAAALASTAQTDQRLIADMSIRFQGLAQCRQDEAARVRADVAARRITRDVGRDRLVNLRNLMLADADIARRVNTLLAQRNQTYSVEAANVDTQLANEPDPVVRRQKAMEVAQARQTLQSNQRALTDQATAINRAAETIVVSSVEWPPGPVRRV